MKISRIVLALIVFSLSKTSVADELPKTISVRGECLVRLTPDRGRLNLTARWVDKSPSEATGKVQEKYSRLMAKVRKMSLKDQELATSQLQLVEDFDYPNGKRVSRGFSASLGLSIETSEISRLGEILKIAQEEKIEEISGLQTFESELKVKSAREDCLVEALKNAQKKASALALAGGVKLGSLVAVVEGNAGSPLPEPRGFAKMAGTLSALAEAAPVEVVSAATSLSISVAAVYELR